MQYLTKLPGYEIALVLTEDEIYYKEVYDLGIRIDIIKRGRLKYDPALFIKFFKICRSFQPDIIHSWGRMTTFYSIPSKLLFRKPLISSLISDSSKSFNSFSFYSYLLNTNVLFSDVVLSNSEAGLEAYKIKSVKARVIHNGVHLDRFYREFETSKVKAEFNINTKYMVIMVASFSHFKDYDLFIDIAKEIGRSRDDITFVGVGDGIDLSRIQQRVKDEHVGNVILTGKLKEVERIVSASDIGILCTKSEGISNSIIEYMALGKPVIATDMTGGSKELIQNGITGFCTERKAEKVIGLISHLIENPEIRLSMGELGRERIKTRFSISTMADKFATLYKEYQD
jgi:glycosyltransferase involved in cell wall biosynthesis